MRSFLLIGLAALTSGQLPAQGVERFEFSEPHMGATFRIVLYAENETLARAGAMTAFTLISRLDSLFSDYRADSEISLLTSEPGLGKSLPISSELWTLLRVAQEWSRKTAGAFDVTIGPLSKLWRWSVRRGELPDAARVEAARDRVGYRLLCVNPDVAAVRFLREGMSLDLGGIAKGFAADAAVAELARMGIHSVLVDAGGDLALGDAPPGESGWRIALPQPEGGTLMLTHAGVATSGDAYRWLEFNGVRYSHIIDPATGLGVPDAPVVVVIAADATSADVLASSLTVLGFDDRVALLRTIPRVAARISGPEGYQTRNFPQTPGANR